MRPMWRLQRTKVMLITFIIIIKKTFIFVLFFFVRYRMSSADPDDSFTVWKRQKHICAVQ